MKITIILLSVLGLAMAVPVAEPVAEPITEADGIVIEQRDSPLERRACGTGQFCSGGTCKQVVCYPGNFCVTYKYGPC